MASSPQSPPHLSLLLPITSAAIPTTTGQNESLTFRGLETETSRGNSRGWWGRSYSRLQVLFDFLKTTLWPREERPRSSPAGALRCEQQKSRAEAVLPWFCDSGPKSAAQNWADAQAILPKRRVLLCPGERRMDKKSPWVPSSPGLILSCGTEFFGFLPREKVWEPWVGTPSR